MVGAATWGSVAFGAYLLGCLGLGAAFLRFFLGRAVRPAAVHPFGLLATAFVLGGSVLSQALVLAALVVDFTPGLVWAALGASALLGGRALLGQLREASAAAIAAVGEWREEALAWQALALATASLVALLALAAIVFPPIGDGEAFYFVYGKFIAAGEQLAPLRGSYEPFSTIGLLGEVHFASLMALSGPGVAKLFVWLVALAACVLAAELGRLCGLGRRGRLALVILVLTSSTFTHYISDGKVDLFAAALGLGAYFWVLLPVERGGDRATMSIAGVMGGLACVAKFSYLPVLAPGLLVILALKTYPRMAERLRAVTALGLAAALSTVPHLVKNGMFFGEPLAPFLTASPERSWISQAWFGPEATAWIVKTYPLALVFGEYPMQGGTISFAWLALLPLAALLPRSAWRREGPLAQATLAGAVALLLWIVLEPSIIAPRYILAPLILLLIPAARAVDYVSARDTRIVTLGVAAFVALAIALVATIQPIRTLPREAVAALRGRLPVCHRAHIYCYDLQPVNRLATPGERAFLLLYHAYWLRPDLLLCRNTAREAGLLKEPRTERTLWEVLYDRGFGLIIADRVSHKRELELLAESPPPWLDVRVAVDGSRFITYRLASRDSSRRPATRCEAAEEGVWRVVEKKAG